MRPVDRLAAVGALFWSARLARAGLVSPWEERIFRSVNDRSDCVAAPVWVVMQTGSLASVFVVGAIALPGHLPLRSAPIVFGGVALWALVKLVKLPVGRGRPRRHLDGVRIRGIEPSGLGYPSGHAAISTALALGAMPAGPVRRVALTVAAATGLARIYVGAHLPLDIVGGAAIGALVADGLGRSAIRS
ncbi:MAG: phosphatase PAP2 family protein [Actinomycetota bacterium]